MKAELACTIRSRLKGLLGRAELDGALVLTPCNDVHTVGMRRPIDVAFVSAEGVVLESMRDVGPNRRLGNARARATIERFSDEGPWLMPGDRVQQYLQIERLEALEERS